MRCERVPRSLLFSLSLSLSHLHTEALLSVSRNEIALNGADFNAQINVDVLARNVEAERAEEFFFVFVFHFLLFQITQFYLTEKKSIEYSMTLLYVWFLNFIFNSLTITKSLFQMTFSNILCF